MLVWKSLSVLVVFAGCWLVQAQTDHYKRTIATARCSDFVMFGSYEILYKDGTHAYLRFSPSFLYKVICDGCKLISYPMSILIKLCEGYGNLMSGGSILIIGKYIGCTIVTTCWLELSTIEIATGEPFDSLYLIYMERDLRKYPNCCVKTHDTAYYSSSEVDADGNPLKHSADPIPPAE